MISDQNALKKLDPFANSASRMKVKWRGGSLFTKGTQNNKFSGCCHSDLVQDFLRLSVLQHGQRTVGWHVFKSNWIVSFYVLIN